LGVGGGVGGGVGLGVGRGVSGSVSSSSSFLNDKNQSQITKKYWGFERITWIYRYSWEFDNEEE